MRIKTSQLSGPALDWAVLNATKGVWAHFTGDWARTGPLVEEYKVSLARESVYNRETHKSEYMWLATTGCIVQGLEVGGACDGDTPLEAICRAIVASELGDEVDVPDELLV